MQSATCQFYIVQNKNGIKRLDGKYTVFGQVISGMDVVDSICHVPRNAQDAPLLRIPTKISIHRLNRFKIEQIRNGKSG
jgi:peptidyl-prolyl cis-trans isomerase B (cyclophilin B)